MARSLQILMPMAGLGSRFAKAGFALPKPLVQVDNQPMFQKALSSVEDIDVPKKYFFVIREEHVQSQGLDKLIKTVLPDANIVVIPKMTKGAAETALAAATVLKPKDSLIVMDCDLWFKSPSFNQMVQSSLDQTSDISGGLLTFSSSDPRYSFAEVSVDNQVTRTAEKVAISNHAITGAYFFATAQDFISSAKQLIELPINKKMPEYYMSLLYNILIDHGKKVQATYVEAFASFGSPEELQRYSQQI